MSFPRENKASNIFEGKNAAVINLKLLKKKKRT